MTGNELLTEFDNIAGNDFNTVLASSKLMHLNIALRDVFTRVKKTNVQTQAHAGGTVTYTVSSFVPRLLEVTSVRYEDSEVSRVADYVGYGWHTPNRDELILRGMAAGNYDIEGYVLPDAIVATDDAISDIDDELFPPLIKLAVYSALGAHEETNEQVARRDSLHRKASKEIGDYTRAVASIRLRAIF